MLAFASSKRLPSALKGSSSYISCRYATVRQPSSHTGDFDELPPSDNDFILSILRANPSLRDTRSYLASFGPRPVPVTDKKPSHTISPSRPITPSAEQRESALYPKPSPVVASILNPVIKRTALVKLQGPFSDVQLESIAKGLVYLEKLGLVSLIVVENDDLKHGEQEGRSPLLEETMRIVSTLEKQGAHARPVLGPVVRLGPKPDYVPPSTPGFTLPEAHTLPSDLIPIRSSLSAGEFPVVAPFALDSFCRSVRVHANDVLGALAQGMVGVGNSRKGVDSEDPSSDSEEFDMTPLRLMIINREGGVPSYARSGYPHLLINLNSEYEYIQDTFHHQWRHSHPTALSNLSLARTCLSFMPPSASAIMVSHRSPSSLIGNLITNKPAVSSSLPHALLQGNRKINPHTPTLLRRGQPVRVVRTLDEIDRSKLTSLLEHSFGRKLDQDAFYRRLEHSLDYVILAGDYIGAAIVTNEPQGLESMSYLDKFAVLPSHQGDGTVDFLWVALHDESYGLGLPFSANPNGGKGGQGEGRDLVWRSRANNPVNKWYFERSSGHMKMGSWILFWCDAEKRLRLSEEQNSAPLSFIEDWEKDRITQWSETVQKIPSSWKS